MHRLKSVFAVLALVALMGLPLSAVAQDATPAASPEAPACVAPEMAAATAATPAAAVPAEEVREGPASRNLAADGQAARDNIFNCLNAGDTAGVTALITPNFLVWLTGGTDPAAVAASLEGLQPASVYKDVDAVLDTNNRIGVGMVYEGISNGPGVLTAERWYFVHDGDVWKLDEIRPILAPDDIIEGATIVPVQIVDYAFAISMNPIPAGPVILRFTNSSASGTGHEVALTTLQEGVTTEQVILADPLDESVIASFLGRGYMEAGQSFDLVLTDLQPGTYTMICGVTTEDNVMHSHLGMVQQFTVEAAES